MPSPTPGVIRLGDPEPRAANSIDCSASTRKSCRRRRSGAKQATTNSDKKIDKLLIFVRRAKAPFLSGCESRPATVAPAGSSRSGRSFRFYSLCDKVWRDDVLAVAWQEVQRICRRVSEATATRYGLLEPEVIVGRLNRLITGWANYFCLGQVSPAYAAVDRHTTRRLRRWLCRKHKARSGRHVRFSDTKLWEEHKLARLGPRTVSFPWAKARSRPRAQCGKSARWVRRAATGNGAMAWTEAPALAKAAGNSYSPRPTATAPVVDSTGRASLKPSKLG